MPHATSLEADAKMSGEDSSMPDTQMTNDDSQEKPTGQDTEMVDQPVNDAQASATALENMFDDDDDEDSEEFSSSAPIKPEDQQSRPPTTSQPRYAEPDTLRQFYGRLFPFRHLFQWLNHSATPKADFQNREFSFWLPGNRVIRYLAFPSSDLLRKQCMQMTPERFEIGPQYNMNPKDRKTLKNSSAFKPVMKELVFDIDMTDYDPIRTCCQGTKICIKCWQFIVMAIRVVDVALREDFGFKHIMWVYSGRRGAHAWISDKRAREMDDQKRKAVANYLEVLRGNEQGKRHALRRPLHPHVERSLKILTPYFQNEVLADQDPWETSPQAEKLLNLLSDKSLTTALKKKWDSAASERSSNQKWADIDAVAEAGNLSTFSTKQLVEAKQDIRLEYTYPRLDAEVSKKLNHLLKSPFVVHPGTGRVCVPINIDELDKFDPFEVPTVTELLQEVDQWDAKDGSTLSEEEKAKVQDWQKTRLKPYVDYFRGHVARLLQEESKGKRSREDAADSMEF
jgi:DNA primase small subunit